MTSTEQIDALATAAGLLRKRCFIDTSSLLINLATDVVLKQEPEEQQAYMSRLDAAYKKGRS